MEQFLRTRLLLGNEKLERLHKATVLVVGLGAVGSYALEALARAGVGRLRLADFDKIKKTNINRQLLALHSTIGRPKAEVARERVLDINPACDVKALEVFAAPESFETLFADRPDIVIDAIDAVNPKTQLLAYCHGHGIPVICSLGAALRTDAFSIAFGDLFESFGCPLGYRLRRRLRGQGINSGIMCVYSTQECTLKGIHPDEVKESSDFSRGRTRMVLGSMPTITGIFGLTIAHKAIEFLAGGFPHARRTPHTKKSEKK